MNNIISKVFPKDYCNKLGTKFPCLKKLTANPKIKAIALEVLKGLGLVLVGATFGALFCCPFSLPILFTGIGIGAAVGGLTYGATFGVLQVIKKRYYPQFNFRTQKPIDSDLWLSTQNETKFFNVCETKIKKLPWYETWKGSRTDKDLANLLWKQFQKNNTSIGECYAMVSYLKNPKNTKGVLPLDDIKAKEVFYRQNLFNIGTSQALNDLQFFENVKTLPEITIDKNFHLQMSIQPYLDLNQPLLGIIFLEDSLKTQAFFVDFDKLRFYDNRSYLSGLHQGYKNKNAFFEALQSHLNAYYLKHKNINKISLRLFV